jgi:antitoxin HicB
MRYAFPADVLQEADGVTFTFPDVPEAITCGATRTEALERAADALVSALATYVEDGRTTPPPPSQAGARPLALPHWKRPSLRCMTR